MHAHVAQVIMQTWDWFWLWILQWPGPEGSCPVIHYRFQHFQLPILNFLIANFQFGSIFLNTNFEFSHSDFYVQFSWFFCISIWIFPNLKFPISNFDISHYYLSYMCVMVSCYSLKTLGFAQRWLEGWGIQNVYLRQCFRKGHITPWNWKWGGEPNRSKPIPCQAGGVNDKSRA